jgi:hypothetical protein
VGTPAIGDDFQLTHFVQQVVRTQARESTLFVAASVILGCETSKPNGVAPIEKVGGPVFLFLQFVKLNRLRSTGRKNGRLNNGMRKLH